MTRDKLARIFRLCSAVALIAFLVVSPFADTEVRVLAGLLNLGLALALVPSLGIRGAGLATVCLAGAWFFLLMMFFSQRHYAVRHDWMRLGAALAVAIGVMLLGRAVIPIGCAHALAAWPLVEKSGFLLPWQCHDRHAACAPR
jgi:hypothetical protein